MTLAYSYSERGSFLESFFAGPHKIYSGTREFSFHVKSFPEDADLTKMTMYLADSTFQKEWENEDDSHWESFLNE